MAIDLQKEKDCKFSTQDVYDIISFSIQAADDNGFMNSFVFNRALYVFAAIVLYPEEKEKYAKSASDNINTAWTELLDAGVIDNMVKDFRPELDMLAENGAIWLDEYTQYTQSARGVLEEAQVLSGDIVQAAAQQLKSAANESGVQNVIDIADKWGMNNTLPQENKIEKQPMPQDSVFE